MPKPIQKTPPVKLSHGVIDYDKDKDGLVVPLRLIAGLEPDPFALLFPPYTEEELDKLADDIRERGLIEPIILTGGNKILDGVNRVEACKRAGLSYVSAFVIRGTEEERRAFVYAKNMLRRHLTDDQRAAIAARFATMEHGGDRKSGVGIKPPIGGLKIADAAAQAKVSKRSVERARAIDKQDPALIDDVIAGKTKLAAATKEMSMKKSSSDTASENKPEPKSVPLSPALVKAIKALVEQHGFEAVRDAVLEYVG